MTKDMTTGHPLRLILLFTIPVFAGNIFQQFYNMADAVIVGRYLGSDALAAVGAVGSLMFLILGFANGLAQGFGIAVSHAFGSKDFKLLRHYVALSLMLTVVISFILTVPTVFLCEQLLMMIHMPAEIMDMAYAYLKIIFAGTFCTMSYNVLSGILRGVGDSKTPLYFLVFSSILNIVLDIFMIVVLELGTAGAAYATVISQGVSAVLCFIYMFARFEILRTKKSDYYFDLDGIQNLLSIGIPVALNFSIIAIGLNVMQSAVNIFGADVVAAYTAASKVYVVVMQIPASLGTTMATYCGQNLGAEDYARIRQGIRMTFFGSFIIAALCAGISLRTGPYAVSWFMKDPSEEILYYAMHYLRIVSWFYTPLAWIFIYRNALQGLDQGFFPMISGLVEFGVRYLVIQMFADRYGYTAVCYADPITWIATALLLMAAYYWWNYKKKKEIEVLS